MNPTINSDDETMIETNIGSVPLSTYREIQAMQYGFDSYDDMYSQGYRLGNGYDKKPDTTNTLYEDRDGDHIPDKIDSTFSPDSSRTQTDINHEDYRKALVTESELDELKKNGFKFSEAKRKSEDGRIAIRFSASQKEEFKKITELGGRNGKHISL